MKRLLISILCFVFLLSCSKNQQAGKKGKPAEGTVTSVKQEEPPVQREEGEPDGKLIEGLRVITMEPHSSVKTLYVFRGDKVKLIIKSKGYPFSVHIPNLNVSGSAGSEEDLELTFKVKEVGSYPMFCNGRCPAGDGAQHANLIVMQFESTEEAFYKELNAAETKELVGKGVYILDVRTPREYYDGHIKGANLIPVQQLAYRLSEIADKKNEEILLYCRSGNRSTVAARILSQNGFKKLYNLRPGIRGWIQAGYELVQGAE